jgi:signal recognition particle subunit SRP54
VDEQMMTEVSDIKSAVDPDEILFVVDAMTGQDAVNTAVEFNQRLNFDGVVLTKLDGDSRGGAALSIRKVVEKPIKFASTGEKMDALTPFYPERMAQRILGMGDVVSLVEKAQEQFDQKQAEKLQKKIQSENFDLEDFLDQLNRLKKMGSMKDLIGMIPGVGRQVKDMDIEEDAFKYIEAIIQSMTPEERQQPQLINGSRRRRIARGAGVEVREVNQLLKQFREMRKMMKTMTKLMGKGRSLDLGSMMGGR